MRLIRIFGETSFNHEIIGYTDSMDNDEVASKVSSLLGIEFEEPFTSPNGLTRYRDKNEMDITLIIEEVKEFK